METSLHFLPGYLHNDEAVLDFRCQNAEDIPELFSRLCPSQDLSSLSVSPLGGGCSNLMFKIDLLSQHLLVRIYGNGTELIIDHSYENRVTAYLSARGIAPTYVCRFINGRIERFIENAPPMTPTVYMQQMIPISKSLAELHSTPFPRDRLSQFWDNTGRPCIYPMIEKYIYTIDGFLSINHDPIPERQSCLREFLSSCGLFDFRQWAISELHRFELQLQSSLQLTFCHNDLVCGNVLSSPDAFIIIDYEYAGFNFPEYDIANYFNEFAGLAPIMPWRRHLPSQEMQRSFIKSYLQLFLARTDVDAFVDNFMSQIVKFGQLSHFYWFLWAIIKLYSEHSSDVEFDYGAYALLRFQAMKEFDE